MTSRRLVRHWAYHHLGRPLDRKADLRAAVETPELDDTQYSSKLAALQRSPPEARSCSAG
jgi:hypothetical protein